MNTLYLYFPQWQGSGKTNDIYLGASNIKKELSDQFSFIELSQPENEELKTTSGVIGYQSVLRNLEKANKTIKNANPDSIFTLGGDCSVEIAPVTYLNDHYNSDLLVLWFDAHGDLNTPESSPSKTFHGMPLRMILGEGEPTLMENCFSKLEPNQVVLVGTRDLDLPEQNYVNNSEIEMVSPGVFDIDHLLSIIEKSKRRNIYIHLDLDVIDPEELPDVMCPTTNGLSFSKVQDSINMIREKFNVVGGSVVEYTSKKEPVDNKVLNVLKSLFLE
ncbi:arginase family protein [Candidatus Woesebacteria bacterium]|nr:arginase family protein [Candidatus Woesebacteria bacterium]